MLPHLIWPSVIISFVLTAAYTDFKWRKIPRQLTVAGLVAGLVVNWHAGYGLGALLAALLAFAVGLGFFSIGAIGGGDVKLITSLAAMLRLDSWVGAMQIAIFAAAVMAIVQIIRHRAVRRTIDNIVELLRSFVTHGLRAHPVLNVQNDSMIRSPFAIAAAVGTIVMILRH